MIRHRVATVGRPGPAWPRAVARWGSGATLPLDVTTCVSAEELRVLVGSATVDLAIVEVGLPGVDRVLADEVRRSGTVLAVVTTPALAAAAERLCPDAVLAADFDADALAAVLQAHTRDRAAPAAHPGSDEAPSEPGDLIAVTGPGGAGASTVAQALATHRARTGDVLLADLALEGDQHVRHGVNAGNDGVFELAEALRHAPADAVVPPTVAQDAGYDLLCGLRRRQEWTVLSGSVIDALLVTLRRPDCLVVADVTADLDGRVESGSLDLEERNGLARAAVTCARAVVVVGRWSTTGVHRLVRALLDLEAHGIARDRLHPVLNHAPRGRGGQALACRAVGGLLEELGGDPWRSPLCVRHEAGVEHSVREGAPLPPRFVRRVGRVLDAPP